MRRYMIGLTSSFAVAAVLLGPAAAAEAPLDRSGFSYEENVTINTACFAAGQKGNGAYLDCVRVQITALKAHPTPDRTALSGAQNQRIERDCSYQRRVGIAAYNDCLKNAMDKPQPAIDTGANEFAPNVSQVFAVGPDRPAQKEAAPLPLPSAVLPQRPGHVDHDVLSAAAVFKKVERSVFVVYATQSLADARARDIMLGSAVAVSEHLLLTNCHVVKDRPVIRIMRDGKPVVATLVGDDPKADRCILQSEGAPLPAIAGVRSFQDLAIGERVFAVGTPAGLDHTLTQGLISSLRNFGARNLVQTDAPISHGNSGGGLFDESGNLIGITTLTLATRPGFQNLNFAVAASDYWEQK
jgi:hypothetical protein